MKSLNKKILFLFFAAIILVSCGTSKSLQHQPDLSSYDSTIKPKVQNLNDSTKFFENNILTKNKFGHYIAYIEGDAYQIGTIEGALTEDLVKKQEQLFFGKVKEIVPSKFKQSLLRQFLKWYNRKMYLNVPNEFQAEILGISNYSSDEFNFIAPKFLRAMYLHGAHDIGHAMQDLALVGCTSVALWGNKTKDGEILVGRNFDFYAGDEFSKDKLIVVINPKDGIPFISVTWGGMIGVVSGMNQKGLTVTINAGKSEIPIVAKTPISIVTREILQYASTTDEAIEIAKKREVFVSESIMVSAANEKRAVLIEVSPQKIDVYEVTNSEQLVCSNHFQSDAYKEDERNKEHIANSHSQYRFERMNELLEEKSNYEPEDIVSILRNKEGLNDISLGYGNEKAINQLLAHHGVVFKPNERKVWVSSNPYQLGTFVCYNLDEIVSKHDFNSLVSVSDENIKQDTFVNSIAFKNYEKYRVLDREVDNALKNSKSNLTQDFILNYQKMNPDLWIVYYKIGKYYFEKGYYKAAEVEFLKAKSKVITTKIDQNNIEEYLIKIHKKIN